MGQAYEDWLNRSIDNLTLDNQKLKIENENLIVNKKQLEIEYAELKERFDRLHGLVSTILFDKGPFPFICGTMGESDQNGMYDYFTICPAFGSDATYTYKKVT